MACFRYQCDKTALNCPGSNDTCEMAEMTSQLAPIDEKLNATATAAAVSDDVMASTWLRVLFVSLYCVVFALGVSGNALVVYVIWYDKSLQTTTNVFIANLAVSDIMMCLLAVPFTPISGLLSDWVFGKVRYYYYYYYARIFITLAASS